MYNTDSMPTQRSGKKVKHGAQGSGERQKFIDLEHELLPPRIDAWTLALSSVDRSRPAPDTKNIWKYWVPEPAMLITSTKEDRRERYVRNWLRARDPWYWLISRAGHFCPPTLQGWRDYLNFNVKTVHDLGKNGQQAEQKRQVFRYFYAAFGESNILNSDGDVHWRGRKIDTLDVKTIQEITWEVHEVGFRVELRELDRELVPVALSLSHTARQDAETHRERMLNRVFLGRPLVSDTLPTANVGLADHDIRARAESLDALRQVLVRWPGAPKVVLDCQVLTSLSPPETLQLAEVEMCRFYCQMFWETAGRAPIVPRRFPM